MACKTLYPQLDTQILPNNATSTVSLHFSYKMDSLYEIKYLIIKSRLPITNLTFLNPYHNYLKPLTIFKRTINTIIHPSFVKIKEYVQSTSFNSYQLLASTIEQFVILDYLAHFTQQQVSKGCTHLYFGAIHFALTFHGKKRHPTTSRITLLDTRFLNFEHVNLDIIRTTLNASAIMMTLFPKFCMFLQDSQLCITLKFQFQVTSVVP